MYILSDEGTVSGAGSVGLCASDRHASLTSVRIPLETRADAAIRRRGRPFLNGQLRQQIQSQRYGTGKIEQTNSVSESGGFSGGAVGCSTGVAGGPTGTELGLPFASATAAAPISATASAHTSRIFLIETSRPENERVDAATPANAIPLSWKQK